MNTEYVSGVQYSCESRPPLTWRERRHSYPVNSPAQVINKRRRSATRTVLLADFRVILHYFRINSIERSYRKAIIKYLRENNAK